jgi:hypothetical protein
MVLQEEKRFEDSARYAVQSAGGNWGSFLSKGFRGLRMNKDVFEGKGEEMRGHVFISRILGDARRTLCL